MKLLDWILGREPVATATGIAAVVTAALGAAAAFGAPITAEQIAALGALAAALAGWAARTVVTPVTSPAQRKLARLQAEPDDPLDTVEGDSRIHGGVPLFLIILAVLFFVLVGGLLASCDALFTDPDEEEDLGAPRIELISHEYCAADHDCGGYEDDEGGKRTCFMFCDNNFPLPLPGGDEQPQSLFPPTPEGLRDFVLGTIQGGIELGRLFAEGTIKFVEALLVGLASRA